MKHPPNLKVNQLLISSLEFIYLTREREREQYQTGNQNSLLIKIKQDRWK